MAIQYKEPPTLSQLATSMGCSRQNVKKIALVLEKKGYLLLEKDEKDGRALVVKLTDKSKNYFDTRENVQKEILDSMFEKLNDEEIKDLFNLLCKLYKGIEGIEKDIDSNKLRL